MTEHDECIPWNEEKVDEQGRAYIYKICLCNLEIKERMTFTFCPVQYLVLQTAAAETTTTTTTTTMQTDI